MQESYIVDGLMCKHYFNVVCKGGSNSNYFIHFWVAQYIIHHVTVDYFFYFF